MSEVRKGDVVLFERRTSYTTASYATVHGARWHFADVLAAGRDGLWRKLRDARGSTYDTDRDRGRTVGQVLVLPRDTVDLAALRASDDWRRDFANPDEARAVVKRYMSAAA